MVTDALEEVVQNGEVEFFIKRLPVQVRDKLYDLEQRCFDNWLSKVYAGFNRGGLYTVLRGSLETSVMTVSAFTNAYRSNGLKFYFAGVFRKIEDAQERGIVFDRKKLEDLKFVRKYLDNIPFIVF